MGRKATPKNGGRSRPPFLPRARRARVAPGCEARVHNYYRPNSPLKTRTHVFALGRGPSAGPAAPPRDPSFILRRGLRPRTPGRGLCPRTPTRGLRPLDPHALRAARSACSVSGSRTPPGALPPDPRYWGAPLTGSPRSIKWTVRVLRTLTLSNPFFSGRPLAGRGVCPNANIWVRVLTPFLGL